MKPIGWGLKQSSRGIVKSLLNAKATTKVTLPTPPWEKQEPEPSKEDQDE